MKKLLVIALALLMVLGIAGCGEYKPPVDVGGNPTIVDPGVPKPPNTGTPQDTSFTVSLYDIKTNRPFKQIKDIFALWNDLESNAIYKAEFDETGVATIEGLDGDYAVTLSALPEGYTYNPNNNIATNDERDIIIYLYQINKTNGTHRQFAAGENWLLNDINTTRGAFRAKINSPGDIVRFYYTTGNYGEYSIESIIDTTANVINPILEVYDASSAFINVGSRTVYDDGGAVNTYTKNFRFERTMDRGWVFIFCIRAEGLNENAYPINIDFIIDKDGELTPGAEYETVVATEAKPYNFPSGTFKYVASLDQTGNNILNGKLFKLDDRAEVDGQPNPEYGHYRFYDETTQTYGGTLFTKINQKWEFVDNGFLYELMPKRFYGKDYSEFLNTYARYTNGDGVYPVTEELQDFLMKFSMSQAYFSDGNGWAETEGHYNASEKNQWLFSCGYYNR
ncbi:MAG: hypothetical protein K2L12_06890 [Clostridia bacterium]|nr:hypothetical protein [Clostridia bacterium]